MNIIFAGSPYPSAKILDYLTKNSLNKVQAVLTKPDAAKKRGKKVFESIVSEKAESLNLCVYKPVELNNPEFKEKVMKIFLYLDFLPFSPFKIFNIYIFP